MSAPDLAAPLYAALVNDAGSGELLVAYKGTRPVFTRRPVPADSPYPLILISPDITISDQDGVNDSRPVIQRDIAVYGYNDTPAHYREVEDIAFGVRDLFHRRRNAITVDGWDVIDIVTNGPRPGPVDDDNTIGRVVSLTIRLARKE